MVEHRINASKFIRRRALTFFDFVWCLQADYFFLTKIAGMWEHLFIPLQRKLQTFSESPASTYPQRSAKCNMIVLSAFTPLSLAKRRRKISFFKILASDDLRGPIWGHPVPLNWGCWTTLKSCLDLEKCFLLCFFDTLNGICEVTASEVVEAGLT